MTKANEPTPLVCVENEEGTKEQRILAAYDAGMRLYRIADMFGVSCATVQRIAFKAGRVGRRLIRSSEASSRTERKP